jgi:hypothetical protein
MPLEEIVNRRLKVGKADICLTKNIAEPEKTVFPKRGKPPSWHAIPGESDIENTRF